MKEPNFIVSAVKNSPLDDDIILGRGTVHVKHPGNKRFYRVVGLFLPLYVIAASKSEKSVIIKLIYDTVSAAGQRFLIEEPPTLSCSEISEHQAKKKIGHTLRYRQKAMKPARKVGSVSKPCPAPQAHSPTLITQGMDSSIPVVTAPSSPASFRSPRGRTSGTDSSPTPMEIAPSFPTHSPSPPTRYTQVEIISDEDLDSVLGSPGEMIFPDNDDESPSSPFVLQPLLQGFRLHEFACEDLDPFSYW